MSIKKNPVKVGKVAKSVLNDPETEVKVGEGHDRASRIKNCKTCKGNPEITDLNLPQFKGKKCETCYEVISYDKI